MFTYTGGNIRIFSDTAFYSFCIHETDTESWGQLCLHTPGGNIRIFSDTAFYSFCIHETDTESWGRLCLHTPGVTYASSVILLFIRFAFTRLIQRVEDGYVCIHRGQHIHLQWYCFLFVLHSRDWYRELRTAMFVYTEGNICILSDTAFYSFCIHETDTESWGQLCLHTPGGNIRIFSDTAFYSFCIHETDTESWGQLCLHTPGVTYASSVILLFIRFAFTRLIQRVEDGYVCIHRG